MQSKDRQEEEEEDEEVDEADEVLSLVPTIRQTDSVAKRRLGNLSIIVTCSENNRVQAKLRIYFRAFCVKYE